jgi:hypothetical protein
MLLRESNNFIIYLFIYLFIYLLKFISIFSKFMFQNEPQKISKKHLKIDIFEDKNKH